VAGAFGLVADVDGAAVSLAVTTPRTLLSITDTNGASATFTPDDPVTLATATTNTEFRGVALAPSAVAGPSVYVRTPVTGSSTPAGTSIKVSAYVDSPDGVDSVKAKVGSGAYVDATKGAGNVWTATVKTTGLAVGKATLTVSATDAAGTPGTSTVTRSLTIGAPKNTLAKGTYAPKNKLIKTTKKWTSYATNASPSKKGLTSKQKGAKATTTAYGKTLVLTFTKGTKAGKVTVKVGTKSLTIDLHGTKSANLKKSFNLGNKSQKVTITVLGKKNAKSKGTAVYLAALQVK
jgi:hypothetical protein